MKTKLIYQGILFFVFLGNLQCSVQHNIPEQKKVAVKTTVDFKNQRDRIFSELTNPTGQNVLVAAHRGAWKRAPENSIAAIEESIAIGVDIVEIDVRKTKDGQLVLMHDKTVDRTTNGQGQIKDLSFEEVRKLRLKDHQGNLTEMMIPTLEEVMRTAKDHIMVNLDKAWDKMSDCYNILEKTNTVNHVILKGNKKFDEVAPELAKMNPAPIYMPIIFHYNAQKHEMIDEYLNRMSPLAFELVFEKEDDTMIAPKTIKKIKEGSARVWVNSLWGNICANHDDAKAVENPDENWGWIIEHGANIIQTDEPGLMLQYLRKKELHW